MKRQERQRHTAHEVVEGTLWPRPLHVLQASFSRDVPLDFLLELKMVVCRSLGLLFVV